MRKLFLLKNSSVIRQLHIATRLQSACCNYRRPMSLTSYNYIVVQRPKDGEEGRQFNADCICYDTDGYET